MGGSTIAMGKKITATIDELKEQKAQLEQQIKATSTAVEKTLQERLAALEERLRGEVREVQESLDRANQEHASLAEQSVEKASEIARADIAEADRVLRAEIEALKPLLDGSIRESREALEQRILEVDGATRDAFLQELQGCVERIDQELGATRDSLQAVVSDTARAAAEALEKARQDIAGDVNRARDESMSKAEEAKEQMLLSLHESVEEQGRTNKKLDQKLKGSVTDIEYKIADVEKDIQKRADATALALQEAVKKAERELALLTTQHTERFDGVDNSIQQLRFLFSDVENVPTRKVEWVIKEAASRLKVPTTIPEGEDEIPLYTSVMSHPFDAAGARALKLELRYYRPTDPPAADQHRGDLALFLHAPEGTHIAFKLTVGNCSDTFEHRFRQNDPLGTRRIAFLKEQVHSVKFTLTLGVEILECIYSFDKKPPPPEEQEVSEEETPVVPLDTVFRMQRHVNNRVLDQVKQQVDYFRKRATRRIEWRLEEASMMKRCFPRGAPMRSQEFDAAGIEGMSLLFFPSGYDSAFDGWCSAFLYAPQGASLRCSLQVGVQKRELNHTFDREGQCGRANFVRFEEAVDKDEDCVFVTLQIEEAHLDLVAQMHHPPPPAVGCRSLAHEATPMRPLGSTVKMQRALDSLPACLQEVKVLPSLWATKNYHELAVKVDGLRPIKDVRIRQHRPKSGARRSPSTPLLH